MAPARGVELLTCSLRNCGDPSGTSDQLRFGILIRAVFVPISPVGPLLSTGVDVPMDVQDPMLGSARSGQCGVSAGRVWGAYNVGHKDNLSADRRIIGEGILV
jgi:hypothetical protein